MQRTEYRGIFCNRPAEIAFQCTKAHIFCFIAVCCSVTHPVCSVLIQTNRLFVFQKAQCHREQLAIMVQVILAVVGSVPVNTAVRITVLQHRCVSRQIVNCIVFFAQIVYLFHCVFQFRIHCRSGHAPQRQIQLRHQISIYDNTISCFDFFAQFHQNRPFHAGIIFFTGEELVERSNHQQSGS